MCFYCQYSRGTLTEEKSTGIKHPPIKVCVCLLLPHINRMVFMQKEKNKQKKIPNKKLNLAWANLQSMEIHVHSQDWRVRSYQCSVYTRCHAVNSFSQAVWCHLKRNKFLWPERMCKTKWLNHGKTLKILKSTTARLIFLGPKLSGYKTLFVSFLNINSFAVNK